MIQVFPTFRGLNPVRQHENPLQQAVLCSLRRRRRRENIGVTSASRSSCIEIQIISLM
jgi:hypothetical protein